MNTNVISMAEYKKKKEAALPYNIRWWLPQYQFVFLPPFFYMLIVY